MGRPKVNFSKVCAHCGSYEKLSQKLSTSFKLMKKKISLVIS